MDNIRYIERMLLENYHMDFQDLEQSDYWELMNVLNAKQDKSRDDAPQETSRKHESAYDFFKSL